MSNLRPNISRILQDESLCDFARCTDSRSLSSFLAEYEVREYLQTPTGRLIHDLSALAAVEFALIRLVSRLETFSVITLPVPITPQDAFLAITKYDTTDTKPCKTAERIIEGDISAHDIFLFTGDWQKYLLMVDSETPLDVGLEEFPEKLNQFVQPAAQELIGHLKYGMWAKFQQLVWKLRLIVMTEAKGQDSKEDYIREAIAKFRDRWGPPAVRGFDFSMLPPERGSRGGPALPIG
jgi:hypothetical protein